jgi:RNA ligase
MYEKIKPYIESKLVNEQVHPDNPDLHIFNYSQHCQFSKSWDEITTQCRGLIINIKTGEIIARPFPKFFNYQEHLAYGWEIPKGNFIVTEKVDGSMGILYEMNGQPWIATRGSFTSDQALWATDWYRKNIGYLPEKGKTELFEIIYPENRIVVNYDFSGLVHLATIDTQKGIQIPRTPIDIRTPKQIDTNNIDELLKLDEPNSEGFVLFYPNENVRLKIKFPEYVRLHKLITGISEIAIWEHLKEEKGIDDLLDKVPDEFFNWVKRVQNDLMTKFQDIEREVKNAVTLCTEDETRKEKAKTIIENTKYQGVAFSMLDKKDYKLVIWRLIRPCGQNAYKIEI